MKITSSAFADGEKIAVQYSCDGENISPPLEWSGVPDAAQSLALIVDDPDAPAGIWVHWVLYNIPVERVSLPEDVSRDANVEGIGDQGINDFGRTGYGGPCPPRGSSHRYYFKLYALDTRLELKIGTKKGQLEAAMLGHILAQAQLMGRYQR